LKLTVAEFPDEAVHHDGAWADLVGFLRAAPTDVLVLPEMPFVQWSVFTADVVDLAAWRAALASHEAMHARFGELAAGVVLGSYPVERQGERLNQAFVWTRDGGTRGARAKYFLPDEPDGREATWFARGDRDFAPTSVGALRVGFQLCTELLFVDRSRAIGRAGAQVIAAPRATSGHRRWPMAAGMAAIASGCFVATANRRSYTADTFAGGSWVISPEGETLAATTAEAPYVTVDVDLADADRARRTYPRYLPDD
jgi:N-carbamoylputrescine amidase